MSKKLRGAAAAGLAVVLWTVGCTTGPLSGAAPGVPFESCTTASCHLSRVSDAQWAEAAANPVVVNFEKLDSNGVVADYAYTSTQWTDPNKKLMVFETGKPYVLKFVNRFSSYNNTAGGDSEHYFTSPEFYRSIAIKKIVTPTATYTAPYLNDFELNAPAHNSNVDTEGLIYFVPVNTGIFTALCKPGQHSDAALRTGMLATLQIAGRNGQTLDFELPADYPAALGDPKNKLKGINYASKPSDAEHWKSVILDDSGAGVIMSPLNLARYADRPGYLGSVVRLKKAAGSRGGYTLSTEFFKTMALRKIHDKHAQIKPYLLRSIEFSAGPSEVNPVNASKPGTGEVDLFMVPTVAGRFDFRFASRSAVTGTGVALVK